MSIGPKVSICSTGPICLINAHCSGAHFFWWPFPPNPQCPLAQCAPNAHLPQCSSVPNVHLSIVPTCSQRPFVQIPFSQSARLPQLPICPVLIFPGAHFPQVHICPQCPLGPKLISFKVPVCPKVPIMPQTSICPSCHMPICPKHPFAQTAHLPQLPIRSDSCFSWCPFSPKATCPNVHRSQNTHLLQNAYLPQLLICPGAHFSRCGICPKCPFSPNAH